MRTFYDRVRESAERWPQNVALEIQRRDQVESYSYPQLRQMAESVARWLVEGGVGPGTRIAILADNHPRWVGAYLGIIVAGGTAVPLDTGFRADQITKLLKDSGSSLLFCDGKHLVVAREATRDLTVRLILIDQAAEDGTTPAADLDYIFAQGPGTFSPIPVSDDSTAALLYT